MGINIPELANVAERGLKMALRGEYDCRVLHVSKKYFAQIFSHILNRVSECVSRLALAGGSKWGMRIK